MSHDPDWVPNPHDEALEYNKLIKNAVPLMLRRGISCAAMADFYRLMYHTFFHEGCPPKASDRIPTEDQLRGITRQVKTDFMENLCLLEFNGEFSKRMRS